MNLPDALPAEAIVTLARADDWRAAVRIAGERLVASGATTDAYTDEMISAIDEHGPYIVIAPGFALAHARPSPAVLQTGLSWVSLAEPVPFGHSVNDPVRLVVGLAATDHDGHIEAMSSLAAILADPAALDELLAADSPSRVRDLLAGHSPA
ncbi:MAG TPA: PTS sugar transporter subunit IIA [Agromyces sp.]|nr:PTS sugar transporter subunit IIA [Agromyces sp.]